MSNRYAIHLETPSGLQFDGMVEADSLYEAAMKWARTRDQNVLASSALVVQDPDYNEEGKLRFAVFTTYRAECIYVASEFDPKALFRAMAVHHEKPAKDTGVDVWTGMRVFELLNIPGLTCHEGIWQALSDEQRARCESIARAINRNSAPRSGLLTGELLYKSLQRANDDLEIKIKDPLCAWEMLTPPPRKYYENAASLLSKELSSNLKQEPEPIDHDFTTAKEVMSAESTTLRIWLAKDEADLNKQMDSMSGNWPGVGGPYCFDVEIGDGDATIVGGDPDPLYRGEIAAVSKTNKHGAGIRIRRDAQDDYIYIFPSIGAYPKEDADGEEWTVDSLKFAFDVEDILFDIDDEMAGHVVRIVNKRRKVKTEAPKEDSDQVRTYSIGKLFKSESGVVDTEVALVVAESMESAARKWAKAFSLSPEGKEKTDVVCVARSDMGAPWSRFKITNKSMNDSDIVYFNNELYSISEHRRKSFADDGSVPEDAPKAISYNVQFTAKRDSTPNSEECKKQFEQAVMRACRERADEQP